MKCILCGIEFDTKGMWAHKRKKQSCVSQKKVLFLYKQLHNLILNHEQKHDIQPYITNIKAAVSDVEINPCYINMNNFGQENTDIIEEKFKIIEKTHKNSFCVFIKLLFCNPDIPTNHTIKITSMNGLYCRTYKNGEWSLSCYEKTMINLVKRFFETFKGSTDKKMEDYLSFIFNVIKNDQKSIRKFIAYTKKHILPEIYNVSKHNQAYLIIKKPNLVKK